MTVQRDGTPKYLVLKATIKDWAKQGQFRPGQQIPTEHQLAEQFRMSRQTVRMAINELVHEQVLVRQQGRGTFVSEAQFTRDPTGTSHRIIAVVTTYITDYIFPSIIRGIEARLSEENYSIMLFSTDNSFEKEATALDNILQRPIDGVILEPTKGAVWNPNLRRYLLLLANRIPVVNLHSAVTEIGVPCVRMDDEQGGELAVQHLVELGHTRIGAIMKSDDTQGRLRTRGMMMQWRRGLVVQPEWIQFYTTDERHSVAEQYALALAAATGELRPTAVICYNDEVAVKLAKHLSEANLGVPDPISIVSFDDSEFAQVHGFTSVAHPKHEMGVAAADAILGLIQRAGSGREYPDTVFQPQIVTRTSTRSQK